jgi:REP-associated tyrosine transposase
MARLPRVVALHVPHHVTQRGNARQFILSTPEERNVYLQLLQSSAEQRELSVLAYCLMSNHIHLVVVPQAHDALAAALKQTHGQYAAYWNAAHHSTGHVWQGRYYSCPLDSTHFWRAMRYAELNPVRARLVASAELWPWSSAAVHCADGPADTWLQLERWRSHWNPTEWRRYLTESEATGDLAAIRRCTHTGRPLGSPEFVNSLERELQRPLKPRKRGRSPSPPVAEPQEALALTR